MDEEDMYSGVVRDEGAAWKSSSSNAIPSNGGGGFHGSTSQPNSASKKDLTGGAGRGAGGLSQHNQQHHTQGQGQGDGGAWKRVQYKTDGTPTTPGQLHDGKAAGASSADGKGKPQPPPPGLVSPPSKGSNNSLNTADAGAGGDTTGTPSGPAGSTSSASTPAKTTAAATPNGQQQPSTASKESHESSASSSDKPSGKGKDTAGLTGASEDQKPKTTVLNPDAKEFKMSASAREFKPTFTIPSAAKPTMPMQGPGGHGGMPGGPINNMAMSGVQGMMPMSPMQQGQQGMGNVNAQGVMPRGGYSPGQGQAQGMMQTNNGQVMVNQNNMQPMNMNMVPAQGGYVNNQYPVQMQYNQYGIPMMMPQMGGPQPVMMSYGQPPPVNQANGSPMQPMGGMDIMQVGGCSSNSFNTPMGASFSFNTPYQYAPTLTLNVSCALVMHCMNTFICNNNNNNNNNNNHHHHYHPSHSSRATCTEEEGNCLLLPRTPASSTVLARDKDKVL